MCYNAKEPKGLGEPTTKNTKTKSKDSLFFTYKDKPLVRCEDTLYYGCMSDKYLVKINIKGKQKSLDLDIANSTSVQLISTDETLRASQRIIKASEKPNLYLAIDIADVWLHRALEED